MRLATYAAKSRPLIDAKILCVMKRPMSAYGPKRTRLPSTAAAAFGGKADTPLCVSRGS